MLDRQAEDYKVFVEACNVQIGGFYHKLTLNEVERIFEKLDKMGYKIEKK